MKELNVDLTSIVFSNEENGYVIARGRAEHEPGQVTLVGSLGNVAPGERLTVKGVWKEHAKFGRQFQVESFLRLLPANEVGVLKYLSSGLIRGVGPVMAERLVKYFGVAILDVLENDPKRLLEVEGIGQKKLEGIQRSWDEQRDIRVLMLFLQGHDISPAYAVRIFRRYGSGAVEKLKENPYDLAHDISGIGFKTADAMAIKLGIPFDSPRRAQAALLYAMRQAVDKGHVFLPRPDLMTAAGAILDGVDEAVIRDALEGLAEKKTVILEPMPDRGIDEAVYLAQYFRMEREVALRLQTLVTHPAALSPEKAEEALAEVEEKARIILAPEQREAVKTAALSKVAIITGGPGTGKTTITRIIVEVFKALGLKIKLAAPTGRAAKRLSEATHHPAATIHRLLGFSSEGSFVHNEENKLKLDALIVDEVSMLDLPLCLHLLRSLPVTCRLILVGDANQLPSVGAGNVLKDLLQSEVMPKTVLTEIFRQARRSLLIVNAHRINLGQFPVGSEDEAPRADFFWVEQDDPEKVQRLILQMVCDRIPEVYRLDPRRDVQVLSPMHKGEVGTQALNILLRDRLNAEGKPVVRGLREFRIGDRVLQARNNYEKGVFNGDLGWIRGMDQETGEVLVDFEDRLVPYALDEMDELTMAYAISVHKSQGSEYPAVVVPMVTQHYVLLQRNLLYTALTRARRLAVLVGSKKAVGIALRTADTGRRFTHLEERLRQAFQG